MVGYAGNVISLANNRDTICNIALKFHNHPSIKMIKNKVRKIAKFSFQQVTLVDVRNAKKDIRLGKYWGYPSWYSKTL